MRLYIDSADLNEIKNAYEYLPVSGLTCNPSILAKAGKDPKEVLSQIRAIVPEEDDLFIQTLGRQAQEMIDDGHAIADRFGMRTIIKVPASKEGYKAMKQLVKEGYRVCATAVYYEQQAWFAGLIGTEFIAPYINRISLQGFDGAAKIAVMQKILDHTQTKIMIASFKSVEQVLKAIAIGTHSLTVTPDVLHMLNDMPVIEGALDKFDQDFYGLVGQGRRMKDVL